eukprot:gene13166-9012_t
MQNYQPSNPHQTTITNHIKLHNKQNASTRRKTNDPRHIKTQYIIPTTNPQTKTHNSHAHKQTYTSGNQHNNIQPHKITTQRIKYTTYTRLTKQYSQSSKLSKHVPGLANHTEIHTSTKQHSNKILTYNLKYYKHTGSKHNQRIRNHCSLPCESHSFKTHKLQTANVTPKNLATNYLTPTTLNRPSLPTITRNKAKQVGLTNIKGTYLSRSNSIKCNITSQLSANTTSYALNKHHNLEVNPKQSSSGNNLNIILNLRSHTHWQTPKASTQNPCNTQTKASTHFSYNKPNIILSTTISNIYNTHKLKISIYTANKITTLNHSYQVNQLTANSQIIETITSHVQSKIQKTNVHIITTNYKLRNSGKQTYKAQTTIYTIYTQHQLEYKNASNQPQLKSQLKKTKTLNISLNCNSIPSQKPPTTHQQAHNKNINTHTKLGNLHPAPTAEHLLFNNNYSIIPKKANHTLIKNQILRNNYITPLLTCCFLKHNPHFFQNTHSVNPRKHNHKNYHNHFAPK